MVHFDDQKYRPNPYSKPWGLLALQVKREAGDKCEECGHIDSYDEGYLLTVHHKDGNPYNNARENLIALCQRCHLRRQGRLIRYGPEGPQQMRLWPDDPYSR